MYSFQGKNEKLRGHAKDMKTNPKHRRKMQSIDTITEETQTLVLLAKALVFYFNIYKSLKSSILTCAKKLMERE